MDLGETLRKEKLKDEKRIPKNGKSMHKGFYYFNGSFVITIYLFIFMVMKVYNSCIKFIEVPLYFKMV